MKPTEKKLQIFTPSDNLQVSYVDVYLCFYTHFDYIDALHLVLEFEHEFMIAGGRFLSTFYQSSIYFIVFFIQKFTVIDRVDLKDKLETDLCWEQGTICLSFKDRDPIWYWTAQGYEQGNEALSVFVTFSL